MNDKSSPIDLGKPSGFKTLVGYRTPVWREGYAEFEVEIGPEHANSSGFLHGGVYMTILDAAMGHASTWCRVDGNVRRCVTLTLNTTFMAVARTRVVRAVGHLISVEGRIATCRAEVVDAGGEICINAQGSYLYMRGSEYIDGVPAAPKGDHR